MYIMKKNTHTHTHTHTHIYIYIYLRTFYNNKKKYNNHDLVICFLGLGMNSQQTNQGWLHIFSFVNFLFNIFCKNKKFSLVHFLFQWELTSHTMYIENININITIHIWLYLCIFLQNNYHCSWTMSGIIEWSFLSQLLPSLHLILVAPRRHA